MLDIVIFWNLRKVTVEKSLRSVKIKRRLTKLQLG